MLISVPVHFQKFVSKKSWDSFKAGNRGVFPKVDFTKKMAIILVPETELDPGIVELVGVSSAAGMISIGYRVSPLKAAATGPNAGFQAIAVVDKSTSAIALQEEALTAPVQTGCVEPHLNGGFIKLYK